MSQDNGDFKPEDASRTLRWVHDEIDLLFANWARSSTYSASVYAFDEIAREIRSIVDAYACACADANPSVDAFAGISAERIGDFAELSLQLLDVCVHLQLWLRAGDAEAYETKMFDGRRLVDPFGEPLSGEDVEDITREFPWVASWYSELAGYARLADDPFGHHAFEEAHETSYGRLFAKFCDLTEVTIHLLRRRLEAFQSQQRDGLISPSVKAVVERPVFADDDYGPHNEQDMAALTRRQSCEGPFDRHGRFSVTQGTGLHCEIERATWGHNEWEYLRSLEADDPTIFMVKRRAKLLSYSRPDPKTDYRHAFPVAAVSRLYDAAAFANRHGVVLNVRLGVSWFNLKDCTEADCGRYFAQYKRNLAQWFWDRGLREAPYPAYIYAHERKAADRIHSHMRLAVPEGHRESFKVEARNALLRVLKLRDLPAKVLWIRFRKIASRSAERRWPVTKDQWRGVMYLLKGVDPTASVGTNPSGRPVYARDINEWEYEDPGAPFTQRRFGASETLGSGRQRNFQDEHGNRFHSLLELQSRHGALDVRELFSDYYLDQAAGRRGPEPPVFTAHAQPALVEPPAPPSNSSLYGEAFAAALMALIIPKTEA